MPVPYNTGFLTICTDWPVKQVVWVAEIWQNSGADALDANVVYFGPWRRLGQASPRACWATGLQSGPQQGVRTSCDAFLSASILIRSQRAIRLRSYLWIPGLSSKVVPDLLLGSCIHSRPFIHHCPFLPLHLSIEQLILMINRRPDGAGCAAPSSKWAWKPLRRSRPPDCLFYPPLNSYNGLKNLFGMNLEILVDMAINWTSPKEGNIRIDCWNTDLLGFGIHSKLLLNKSHSKVVQILKIITFLIIWLCW